MKKYTAENLRYGNAEIKVVEIAKETGKSVFFHNGRRELKKSDWINYFDSWEDAHNFLLHKAEAVLEATKQSVLKAETNLNKIKGMVDEQ